MSQYQRSDFRSQMLPEIDHRGAVWQAYFNVLNSFSFNDMIGASAQGESMNISRTPQERFAYNLGILDAQIEQGKDDAWRKEEGFPTLPDLLAKYPPNEVGRIDHFEEYFRFWTRVDALLRRTGMFTTSKLPSGHL